MLCCLYDLCNSLGSAVKDQTRFCRYCMSRIPDQKNNSQFFFQFLDLITQSGLRNKQSFRRSTESSFLHNSNKIGYLIQIQNIHLRLSTVYSITYRKISFYIKLLKKDPSDRQESLKGSPVCQSRPAFCNTEPACQAPVNTSPPVPIMPIIPSNRPVTDRISAMRIERFPLIPRRRYRYVQITAINGRIPGRIESSNP